MTSTTPDAELDAAAFIRAFLNQDRDAVRVILTHADHAALAVELADLAASVILGACHGDQAAATAVLDEHQRALITGEAQP